RPFESLARAIAGKTANARQFDIGCRIAAAQLNLLQVRQIRQVCCPPPPASASPRCLFRTHCLRAARARTAAISDARIRFSSDGGIEETKVPPDFRKRTQRGKIE